MTDFGFQGTRFNSRERINFNYKLLKRLSLEKVDQIPLFNKLPDLLRRDIDARIRLRKCNKNSIPFDEESTSKYFYFIVSGKLKVYQTHPDTGREFTIFLLKENDIFDVFTLMDDEKHPVETLAFETLSLFAIDLTYMKELMHRHSSILKGILPHVGKRLRILENTAVNFAIADTSVRLAKIILENYHENFQISHDELAKLVGTTRAVVNRHLQEIKALGIIDIQRKRILIKKKDQLEKIVQMLKF